MPLYAYARISDLWLVDPEASRLEIYARERAGWRLMETFREDDPVSAAPFEAVEIDLGRLSS